MIPVITIICIVLAIFYLFSSRFSAIPFFPSNNKDLDRIIDFLKLQNNQTIVDLGAGTGTVIFEAANMAYSKKLDTQFIAIDINPILTAIMHIRRLFHPNRKHIHIKTKDIFTMPYPPATQIRDPRSEIRSNSHRASRTPHRTTYYMYISPHFVAPLARKIKEAHERAYLVTYFYELKGVPPEKHTKGVHDVYRYHI